MTHSNGSAPQGGKRIDGEPLRVRWRLVLLAMIISGCAAGLAWSLLAPLAGWEGWRLGMAAVASVVPVALLGWMVTAPWRPRAAIDWITIWLAGTVIRLLLTPLAAISLYSLTPCDTRQFVGALGGVYFAVLLAEVGSIALSLPRAEVGSAKQEEHRL